MSLEEQLLPHVGDRRRGVVVGSLVVMAVVETAAADFSPDSVQVIQFGRREEVKEAIPLGPLGHHLSVPTSLSN